VADAIARRSAPAIAARPGSFGEDRTIGADSAEGRGSSVDFSATSREGTRGQKIHAAKAMTNSVKPAMSHVDLRRETGDMLGECYLLPASDSLGLRPQGATHVAKNSLKFIEIQQKRKQKRIGPHDLATA
jgi:hypothetical protein